MSRSKFAYMDLSLLWPFLMLPLLSLLVMYSAGYDAEISIQPISWLPLTLHSEAFSRQLINIIIGLAVGTGAFLLNLRLFRSLSVWIYLLSILLIFLVLVIGVDAKGSTRWLNLPGFRFQPSEFSKAATIIIMSYFISKFPPPEEGYSFKQLILPAVIIFPQLILIMKQPDLGTGLAVSGIGASMLIVAGIRKKLLFTLITLGLLAIYPAWHFALKPYQQKRVLTLIDPSSDPLGSGYHINQSKIAVGSGGLFGRGYLNGTQSQLEFLPEHTTDFAFSVLAEEFGFVGSFLVLAIYFYLILRLLWLAQRVKDPYQSLFCLGFALFIFLEVFINVGMVLGILPVVGIPLPLFSYGGSAMLVILFLSGITLNISASSRRLFDD